MNKGLRKSYTPRLNSETRIEHDFYPTPDIAVLTLLNNSNVPQSIWEPCAGKGHISRVLDENGIDVFSTDLYDYPDKVHFVLPGFDYLTTEIVANVEGIITNPPFEKNLPEKMIRHALVDHGYTYVAMLLRLTFLESAKRYKLFTDLPPSTVIVFSERIHVGEEYREKNNGIGGMMAYAWFVWDYRVGRPNTEIVWAKPSDYLKELKKRA